MGPNVIDVTDADFEESVIAESKERPVVVDMWASWCGPCRVLGPILEKVAGERGGAFLLAKLDVDANPQVASVFGVQSIPTVVAFRDGQPVTGFIGAYPEPAVNEFIDSILPEDFEPSSDEKPEPAAPASEAEHRATLERDPSDRNALLGLAAILLSRGELDEARDLIAPLLPDRDAAQLDARVSIARWSDEPADGSLGAARRAAAEGRWREALEGSLSLLPDDPEPARSTMLTVFLALGDDDPLVQEYRRRLTNALF
jgi:putative thioredoxin